MFIIQCLYFILPTGIANMIPVFVRRHFKFLGVPLDFGKTFRGKRIFGDNKTFRGIIFGSVVGILVVFIQTVLYNRYAFFKEISIVPYDQYNFAFLGFLMGFGAMLGDLIKSFFKRQVGKKPGEKFFPFDQVDFLLGALLLTSIVFRPSWKVILFLILVIPFFHVGLNRIGYILKIQKTKW
jgi:CDP-2,3-bis-(O-geranylgeranyl)-sn-glycerol synthase